MTRGGRRVLAVLIALAALGALAGLLGPSEEAPHPVRDRSPGGLAAWAALLEGRGVDVRVRTRALSGGGLRPGEPLVLAGAEPAAVDLRAALDVAARGGRVVATGGAAAPLARRLGLRPRQAAADGPLRRVRRVPATRAVGVVEPPGRGRLWAPELGPRPAGTRVLLADRGDHVGLLRVPRGRGEVLLLPDPAVLQNADLARADHAALGLALAGGAPRVVVAAQRGGGLPARVGLAALLGGIAALALVLAAARRLGPPDPAPSADPPPRGAYVDAMAAAQRATGDVAAGVAGARDAARRVVAARAALGPDPAPGELRSAALRLGLSVAEADALAGAPGHEPLAAGRALAALSGTTAGPTSPTPTRGAP